MIDNIWLYTIGSTLLVSLVALIGILTLAINEKHLQKILILLVSFAAGSLIGDVFIHILPEAVEEFGFDLSMSLAMITGILTFFILEKFVHWHHCHNVSDQHHKPFIVTNLMGDMLHSFIDGLFIAGSYLVDIKLGIATTIAVMLHEAPQEIGDFGLLLHGGVRKSKALLLNFGAALFAIAGATVGLLIGETNEELLKIILPFTAGAFIYIAHTDLFPELHKESENLKASGLQFLMILAGIGTMALLLLLELEG